MTSTLSGVAIRRRVNRDRTTTWQVRWRERGHQLSKSFGSRFEADEFASKVGVIKQVHSVVAASLVEPGKLLDLIPEYVDLVRTKNKPGSQHAGQVQDTLIRSTKRMGVSWTSEIDSSALDRLVRAHGEHRSTLKKAISTIKTFLRWVRRSRMLVDEWVLDYKAPKHIAEERLSWSEEQVRRLLAECDKPNAADSLPPAIGTGRGSPEIMARMLATRDHLTRQAVRPALWLMLRYGPRPIEVSKLSVGDWDPESRTLTFPAKITKNGHSRSFVVDSETAEFLTTAAGDRLAKEPLFRTYKQHAWTSHHLTDMITVLIQRSRLPGTAYCCRHTACTRLIYLAKGDLPLVQSITGHRTLSELQRYLHATGDRRHTIAQAYETIGDGMKQGPSYLRVVP
jgi:site-specific recombinase XerD